MTTEEKLEFQAEVSRLLDIVANALYSNKEIFLRELISNASDACDRLRYAAITSPELTAGDPTFRITLESDPDSRCLTIADNGIGMSREELVANLGTIARSGSAAFVKELGDQAKDVDLIGQFGVGFYSSFMVADQVTVETRKAGEAQGWRWESDGKGSFTIAESDAAPARGTRIALHLKEDAKDYLQESELKRIVKTYSDHIGIPITLVKAEGPGDTLNSAGALWTRPKSEISEDQYREFYHHVAHAFDEPWDRLHFKAEGAMEYTGLLFIPSAKPINLFDPERRNEVKLYVKRVFITDDCRAILPPYLRFLRGIVDSEDLPLNISRELLQDNPLLGRMRRAITKRVLGELEKKATKEPESYVQFWETFGPVLKEGLYEDLDQRERLVKLTRFRSTESEGLVSLDDYIARMKPGQTAIYTLSGDELDALQRSPQLEGFRAKGIEVLLLTDPVDEFWMPAMGEYEGKPFKSVTRGGADLDTIEGEAGETADKEEATEEQTNGLDTLLAFIKLTLKDKVKDVRLSNRLRESPVCLVADDGDMDLHLSRLLKQHHRLDQEAPRVLEVNPKHPLVLALAKMASAGNGNAGTVEEAAHLLLDQARILEGETPLDQAAFSRRLSDFLAQALAA